MKGNEIARGGEGIIYEVVNDRYKVIKDYFPHLRTPEKEQKLRAMIANPPQDDTQKWKPPHISIAWPQEIYYEQGRFVGYVMPRISQSPDIYKIYNPGLRKKNYSSFTWQYLHRTAKNLATAFNALHRGGYVIGDVNQKNVLVTNNALVTLVDTDSFQVTDSKGRIHRCPVGVPEYTPPELQGKRLDAVDRTDYNDSFGLGVMIFQLLMEGFHPFTGAPKNPTISYFGEVYLHCIKAGIFPYHSNREFNPPPSAPNFNTLHPEIQNLFVRCFIDGHRNSSSRPTANEWIYAIDKAEGVLVQCRRDSTHWYSSHTGKCHWCEREQQKPIPVQQPIQPLVQVPIYVPPAPNYIPQPSPKPKPTKYIGWIAIVFTLVIGSIGFATTQQAAFQNPAQKQAQELEEYTAAIKLNPNNAGTYIHRASFYSDQKEYEKALADINRAIELKDPKIRLDVLYSHRRNIYISLKEYDKALADSNKVIEIDPNSWSGYSSRAVIYLEQKEYDKALADYNTALELNPNPSTGTLYIVRGNFYLEQKEYDKALADYNTAIQIDSRPSIQIGNTSKGGDPFLSSAYMSRGSLYLEQKEYDKALADYNKALEISPEDISPYISRGDVYLAQKKYDEALADYNKAVEIYPSEASYTSRGDVHLVLKQHSKAIADYNKAIELIPNSAYAYNGLGNVYSDLKQYDKALVNLRKAADLYRRYRLGSTKEMSKNLETIKKLEEKK